MIDMGEQTIFENPLRAQGGSAGDNRRQVKEDSSHLRVCRQDSV
jgi:hypothetical protein